MGTSLYYACTGSEAARTGSPWRDLPEAFGKWFTVYTRFWRWAQKGVWERVFKALATIRISNMS